MIADISVTTKQAYCILVGLMAPQLGGDEMVELGAFEDYQEIVDLFEPFDFMSLDAEFKDRILALFSEAYYPGEDSDS